MRSIILQRACRALQPLLLFISFYLLARGHHEPGGGFVGGLVAASAYALQSLAFGTRAARATLPLETRSIVAWGLLISLFASLVPLAAGHPYFAASWSSLGGIEIGTPMLFDVGIFLAVLGSVLSILFVLQEEDEVQGEDLLRGDKRG